MLVPPAAFVTLRFWRIIHLYPLGQQVRSFLVQGFGRHSMHNPSYLPVGKEFRHSSSVLKKTFPWHWSANDNAKIKAMRPFILRHNGISRQNPRLHKIVSCWNVLETFVKKRFASKAYLWLIVQVTSKLKQQLLFLAVALCGYVQNCDESGRSAVGKGLRHIMQHKLETFMIRNATKSYEFLCFCFQIFTSILEAHPCGIISSKAKRSSTLSSPPPAICPCMNDGNEWAVKTRPSLVTWLTSVTN